MNLFVFLFFCFLVVLFVLGGLNFVKRMSSTDRGSDTFRVESRDIIELENIINVPKSQLVYPSVSAKNKRGNHRIAQYFKNSVPLSQIEPGVSNHQRNFSKHHIYPNSNIYDLPDIFNRDTVQRYINTPHIKRIIRENSLDRRFRNSEIIHTAIGNNPNNLVHGPNRSWRANDPADTNAAAIKIDEEIKNAQPYEYRMRFDEFSRNPSLDAFSRLPQPSPIVWRKDYRTNKYIVRN